MKVLIELVGVPFIVLAGMSLALEFGCRLRRKHQREKASVGDDGLGTVDGAIFGLMGLLLAFTFSGAASRFDERRDLIVEEANAIGTAYLRIDLLAAADQPPLREKFREYLESRLDVYKDVKDAPLTQTRLQKCLDLQSEIWKLAVIGSGKTGTTAAAMLLLPALNEMIDIVTTRTAATMKHPPFPVLALLIVVLVLCAMLAGYRIGDSSQVTRIHRAAFVLVLAVTYYVIIDLEYPRLGVITVEPFDQVLIQLRDSMR